MCNNKTVAIDYWITHGIETELQNPTFIQLYFSASYM